MKKVLIVGLTIAFTAIVNAATVSWSMNNIVVSPDNADRSTYMAYLFDATAGFSTVTEALANGDTSVLSSALGSKAVTSSGGVLAAKAMDTYHVTGDYVTAFAIILNNTVEDATYFLAVPEKTSASAVSSAGAATVAFGTQAANTTWQAVPEPTSGLLMLVGLAGLALRRRRA